MKRLSTKHLLILCAIIWVVILWRGIGNVKGPEAFIPTTTQDEMMLFAKNELTKMQEPSFQSNQEICGVIIEGEEGELTLSYMKQGDSSSCEALYYDSPGEAPLAVIHTHGSYSGNFGPEYPSPADFQTNIENEGVGYIATPGGRFWLVDGKNRMATQICGASCLPRDPAMTQKMPCPPAKSYTPHALRNVFEGEAQTC